MTDIMLAAAYRPKIFLDKKEPFEFTAVGYTVFRQAMRSASFPKRIVSPRARGCVIEYAFWYDYDIQHLYELEHIWVYIDADGRITDAEGSCHGKYMRLVEPVSNQMRIEDGTRVCAYAQPGKHAFAASPELFHLFPGVKEACMEEAGADGIAPGSMVEDCFNISEGLQEKAKAYIKEHYAFEPLFSYEEKEWPESLLLPWEDLLATIPGRMNAEIDKIKEYA